MPTRHDQSSVERYYPENVPVGELSTLWEYLRREFFSVYRGFQGMHVLDVLGSEPPKAQEGMLAYADGTNWNPGSGKGVYVYNGTAWVKL